MYKYSEQFCMVGLLQVFHFVVAQQETISEYCARIYLCFVKTLQTKKEGGGGRMLYEQCEGEDI